MSLTLSFVLLALTISSEVIASENVLVMTDDNAQELFDSHELLLVKFYAPWCGHCKSLAPKYDQAADILQADGSNIQLAKVNATENKALASKHEIQGYPTLLFFKNGKPTKYTGGREAQQIVDWLSKKNGPSVLEIETVEQLDELKESKKIVLGHFTETFPLFNEIADEIDEVVFVSSKNADVLKAASLEGEGISSIRRDGSEFEITSLGKEQIESLSQLKAWIHGHQLAAVNEFTQETANLILGGEIKDFHFLLAARSSENFDEIYAQFTAAAKLFRGRVVFVFLDADKEESARIMEFLGVSSSDLPTDRIVNLKADIQTYKPAAGQSYQEFTQTYLDGGAGRDFKSQEFPSDWDAQPVKILVAENFEKGEIEIKDKYLACAMAAVIIGILIVHHELSTVIESAEFSSEYYLISLVSKLSIDFWSTGIMMTIVLYGLLPLFGSSTYKPNQPKLHLHDNRNVYTMLIQPTWLALPEEVECEIAVSSIIDVSHFFVQQPTHPSFASLHYLDQYMMRLYGEQQNLPELSIPCQHRLLLAAPVGNNWFRAVTVQCSDETDEVIVKFVDHGGYSRMARNELRQLKADLLWLPFQSTEIMLAHVRPVDGTSNWSQDAMKEFTQLCTGRSISCKLVGYAVETKIPMVELFVAVKDGNGDDLIIRFDQHLMMLGLARAADQGFKCAAFSEKYSMIVVGSGCKDLFGYKYNEKRSWLMGETIELYGYGQYGGYDKVVNSVAFHPYQSIFIGCSNDNSIGIWLVWTNKCIDILKYQNVSFGVVAAHPNSWLFAAGHENGMILFKNGIERPVFCINDGYAYYMKEYNSELRRLDLKNKKESLNSFENAFIVTSRTDYSETCDFEFHKIQSKNVEKVNSPCGKGSGIRRAFWIPRKDCAVLNEDRQIELRDVSNVTICQLDTVADDIFYAGSGMILLRLKQEYRLFDVEKRLVTASVELCDEVRYVLWSESNEYAAFLSKKKVFLLNRKLKVLCIQQELNNVKTGCWIDESVFVYNTRYQIKYALISGHSGTIKTLEFDKQLYIFAARGLIISCFDRDSHIVEFPIEPSEYKIKLAVFHGRTEEALHLLDRSKCITQSVIELLIDYGYDPKIVFGFAKHESTRFQLALECESIEKALKYAERLNSVDAWEALTNAALLQGNHRVLEVCYKRTNNFEKLYFLYLVTGNTEKLKKLMGKISDLNARFHIALLIGDVGERIRILKGCGQTSLAFLVAATYGCNDEADELKKELELNGQTLPTIDTNARLLVPPRPLDRLIENWPVIRLTPSFEDEELGTTDAHEENILRRRKWRGKS